MGMGFLRAFSSLHTKAHSIRHFSLRGDDTTEALQSADPANPWYDQQISRIGNYLPNAWQLASS
jgi:hypothetical protein